MCPRLLLLPSRLTPVFLVQSPASLGFNLLFVVFLDLDLGAPGLWEEVNTEMSPGLPLPSILQTPRVGGHLDKFLSVKFGNLHMAQVDYKSTCSEPSTLLGMQACGIEILPLPRNLAYFLIVVLLGEIKQNFSKGHKIPSHQRIVKTWLL